MAELGATVLATDFSTRFLEQARERTETRPDLAGRIDYQVLDATDEAALLALGLERFDAAVCSMGVMDMVEIRPMLRAVQQLLRPGGRFVITLMHPCFNHSAVRLSLEEEDIEGEIVETRSVKVLRYLSSRPTKGLGMFGQPKAQYYFHRPLVELFGSFFEAGFVIDGIEEPAFRPEDSAPNRALGWDTFTEIPPVMSIRLRPTR
jgi:SAM-dependent methyltransferase